MVDEIARLEEQIERCRRLASALTDPDLRESLQELADEYEAQLRSKRRDAGSSGGFMLQDRPDPS